MHLFIVATKKQHAPPESDFPPKLARPVRRALAGAGHGIGPNALSELRRALRAKGLSFGSRRFGFEAAGGQRK
jgi:hypothetical protein